MPEELCSAAVAWFQSHQANGYIMSSMLKYGSTLPLCSMTDRKSAMREAYSFNILEKPNLMYGSAHFQTVSEPAGLGLRRSSWGGVRLL